MSQTRPSPWKKSLVGVLFGLACVASLGTSQPYQRVNRKHPTIPMQLTQKQPERHLVVTVKKSGADPKLKPPTRTIFRLAGTVKFMHGTKQKPILLRIRVGERKPQAKTKKTCFEAPNSCDWTESEAQPDKLGWSVIHYGVALIGSYKQRELEKTYYIGVKMAKGSSSRAILSLEHQVIRRGSANKALLRRFLRKIVVKDVTTKSAPTPKRPNPR